MKKFYNNPKMNISLFEDESVVTNSSPQTAHQQAEQAIDAALGAGSAAKAITIDITSY